MTPSWTRWRTPRLGWSSEEHGALISRGLCGLAGMDEFVRPRRRSREGMPNTLSWKAVRYQELHARQRAFIAGGCWDAGSALMLAHAGLEVLETSSAGVMFARGMPDGDGLATRDLMLENARSIAAAVGIPVTADLENGFGNSPEVVEETIRLAGAVGIVGGSIEDTTGDRSDLILPLGLAV